MDSNLVFLCGFPSSGTDLLKNVVNAHSEVFVGGEFPFLPKLASRFESVVPAHEVNQVISELQKIDVYHNFENPNITLGNDKTAYTLAEIYALMLTDKYRMWKGNKTPQNTENIDKLKVLFPQAKFILIVRDIRDVALSWQKKWGKNKLLCAHKWNVRMQKGIQLLNTLETNSFIVIKYEDLLVDLQSVVHRICDFLDLEYQETMLQFHEQVNHVIEGKLNYGQPLVKNNAFKWEKELSIEEIKRIEEIAFDALTQLNYPIFSATSSSPLSAVDKYFGILEDVYSLFFVGNRAVEKPKRFQRRVKSIGIEICKRFS